MKKTTSKWVVLYTKSITNRICEIELSWMWHIRKGNDYRPPFQASIRELVNRFPGMRGVQHIVWNFFKNIYIFVNRKNTIKFSFTPFTPNCTLLYHQKFIRKEICLKSNRARKIVHWVRVLCFANMRTWILNHSTHLERKKDWGSLGKGAWCANQGTRVYYLGSM